MDEIVFDVCCFASFFKKSYFFLVLDSSLLTT